MSSPASLDVGARAETSVGSDGSYWVGSAVTTCARLGAVCPGGLARFALDLGGADAVAGRDSSRVTVELLAMLAFPRPVGPVVVTPAVAAGLGWAHREIEGATPAAVAPTAARLGPRLEASLSLVVPLRYGFAVNGSLVAGAAPLAQSAPRMDGVPGEPWGALRAGLGLRWEGP